MTTATQPLAEGEVEFVLPLGMTLEELQAGQPDPEPEVVAPVVVEPVVTPPSPAPRGGTVPLPALLEERRKRQDVTALWRQSEADRARLERDLRARSTAAAHAIEISDDEMRTVKEKADASGSIGEAVELAINLIRDKTKVQARVKTLEDRQREMREGETSVRKATTFPGTDVSYFEPLVRKAGLWDAVQPNAQNQYADPALATRVYLAPNPAAELLDVAISKLESEGRLESVMQEVQARVKTLDDRRREMQEGEEQVRKATTLPGTDASYFEPLVRKAGLWDSVQPNAQNQYGDPALATRVYMAPNPAAELLDVAISKLQDEGRLESVMQEIQVTITPPVAAAVEVPSPAPAAPRIVGATAPTSDHPRGIRGLPSAGGPPRGVLTKADLDRLMNSDPDRYSALLEANPGLERMHLE